MLFVGTKKQAQEVVAEEAERVGMPYVNERWLGGMLTNFETIQRPPRCACASSSGWRTTGAIDRLPEEGGDPSAARAREARRTSAASATWSGCPTPSSCVDTKKEHIAVTEARKLQIPVIAIVDTNCDPDDVDFVIPGNDDAIRAVNLMTRVIADALDEGYGMAKEEVVEARTARAPRAASGPKPQAAPAAVEDMPSAEEAAAIAASDRLRARRPDRRDRRRDRRR